MPIGDFLPKAISIARRCLYPCADAIVDGRSAEDLAHEALMQVHRKQLSDSEIGRLLPLVVRNLVVDASRRDKHFHGKVKHAYAAKRGQALNPYVPTPVIQQIMMQQMTNLSLNLQTALTHLMNGLSADECSKKLGISVSAVQKRWSRGKRQLNERVEAALAARGENLEDHNIGGQHAEE